MKWSVRIATVAGIGIFMHWTFLLFLGWRVWADTEQAGSLREALPSVLFWLALFGCVVLHELGHALMARRFGIRTRDIILLPIGGVARLERMPRDPTQELLIALAGPAVNVVIAIVLGVVVVATTGTLPGFYSSMAAYGMAGLFYVNVSLVLFNLLPAFPMDGGRVLRGLLGRRMSYARATRIAANIGQAMAILFGLYGLYEKNLILLFIALFVYLGAEAEARGVAFESMFAGTPVRDAMMTRFRAVAATDSVSSVITELLAGSQQDFPVVRNGEVVGMLFRNDLMRAIAERGPAVPVADVMQAECKVVDADAPLEEIYRLMAEKNCGALPVLSGGRLAGLVTLENIAELAMVRSALEKRPQAAAPGHEPS